MPWAARPRPSTTTPAGAETTDSDVATQYTYDGDNNVADRDRPTAGRHAFADDAVRLRRDHGRRQRPSTATTCWRRWNIPTRRTGSAQQQSEQETYTYNALGPDHRPTTDRNGTTHQYTYDVLGRQTSDAVTTLGTGVDGAVRRIDYAYDSQGNQYLVTSYDASTGGSIVNQVEDSYNGLGQLTAEYQSHVRRRGHRHDAGRAVRLHRDGGRSQNNSRLTSITYPNGYVARLQLRHRPRQQHQPPDRRSPTDRRRWRATSTWAWIRWSSATIRRPAST